MKMTQQEYDKKLAELREVCDDAYKAYREADQVWDKAYKAINDLEASWAQESEAGK